MSKEKVDEAKSNKTFFIIVLVIAFLAIFLLTNGFGLFDGTSAGQGQVVNSGAFVPLAIGEAPVIGEEDAPVTIYEFSDFSCPFCGGAAGENQEVVDYLQGNDPTWIAPVPGIIENYVETGQVKLVWKYFPGHGTGQQAQRVGWCLNDQDLFWEFHDLAFRQPDDTNNLGEMKSLAEQVGADMDLLDQCLDESKYEHLFAEDTNMGRSNGVAGTPGFFVNGVPIRGAASYTTFQQIIDAELAKVA